MKWFGLVVLVLLGVHIAQATRHGIKSVLPVRVFLQELQLWRDFYYFVRRRQFFPTDAQPIMHTKGMWTLPIAIGCASIIELIAIELLLDSLALRLLLAVLSGYGIFMLIAYCGRQYVYPSYMDSSTFVIKVKGTEIALIPITSIASIHPLRTFATDNHLIKNECLILGGPEGTNIEVILDPPVRALGPRWWRQEKQEFPVSRLQLWADKPEGVSK